MEWNALAFTHSHAHLAIAFSNDARLLHDELPGMLALLFCLLVQVARHRSPAKPHFVASEILLRFARVDIYRRSASTEGVLKIACLTVSIECHGINWGRTPDFAPSCYTCPLIALCPSYPQPVVLFPLILTRNAARVIPVIPVRRGLPNPSPKEVAFAQAQEGSDTRLQVLL
jgi:hypothetical protein